MTKQGKKGFKVKQTQDKVLIFKQILDKGVWRYMRTTLNQKSGMDTRTKWVIDSRVDVQLSYNRENNK